MDGLVVVEQAEVFLLESMKGQTGGMSITSNFIMLRSDLDGRGDILQLFNNYFCNLLNVFIHCLSAQFRSINRQKLKY